MSDTEESIEALMRAAEQQKRKDRELKESEAGFLARKQGKSGGESKEDAETLLKEAQESVKKSEEMLSQLKEEQAKLQKAMMQTKRRLKQMHTEVYRQKTLQQEGRSAKKPTTQGETPKAVEAEAVGPIVITDELTAEQLEGFKQSFDLFDTDGDGKITTREVRSVLDSLGQPVTDDIYKLLDDFDENKNGTIEMNEFINIMVHMKKMYASDDYVGLPVGTVVGEVETTHNLGKKIEDVKSDEKLDEELRDFAASGNVKGMEALIKRGADINSKSEKTGFTALHRACAENNVEAVLFLLQQPGIDIHVTSKFGQTPPQLASLKKAEIEGLFAEALKGEGRMEVLTSIAAATRGPMPHPMGKYHVYISHVYAEHAKAVEIQKALEKLKVKVYAPDAFINTEEKIEADLTDSDVAVVLVTKQFLRSLDNERSGIYKEFHLVKILKADVEREIIYILADSNIGTHAKLDELPGFRETKTFTMSNSKEVSENIDALYHEIDARLSM